MMSPLWSLLDVSPADPRVRALMDAHQAELAARYEQQPAGRNTAAPVAPGTPADAGGALLAAERGAELLGGGGLRRQDAQTAELAWMYTIPAARGLGLGRQLLLTLLERARQLGYRRVVLRIGERQPEARALCEAAGFRRMPEFGDHAAQQERLCFGLQLDGGGLNAASETT